MGLVRFRSRACRFRTNAPGANSFGRMLCAPTGFRWTVGAAISRPQSLPPPRGKVPSECEADEGESIKKNTEIRYAPSSVSLAADSFPLRGGSLGGRPKGLPYAKPNLFRFSRRGDPHGRPNRGPVWDRPLRIDRASGHAVGAGVLTRPVWAG